MGVPEKVVNVIIKLMEVWETKLELTDEGKLLTERRLTSEKFYCKETAFLW